MSGRIAYARSTARHARPVAATSGMPVDGSGFWPGVCNTPRQPNVSYLSFTILTGSISSAGWKPKTFP